MRSVLRNHKIKLRCLRHTQLHTRTCIPWLSILLLVTMGTVNLSQTGKWEEGSGQVLSIPTNCGSSGRAENSCKCQKHEEGKQEKGNKIADIKMVFVMSQ